MRVCKSLLYHGQFAVLFLHLMNRQTAHHKNKFQQCHQYLEQFFLFVLLHNQYTNQYPNYSAPYVWALNQIKSLSEWHVRVESSPIIFDIHLHEFQCIAINHLFFYIFKQLFDSLNICATILGFIIPIIDIIVAFFILPFTHIIVKYISKRNDEHNGASFHTNSLFAINTLHESVHTST